MWWRAVDARVRGWCYARLARRCVRGSTLRALGAVCASRALLTIFCLRHHSETRMFYFFALPIWLVVVSAQVTMNPANAAALNQTLTGLGCWQSSTCKTLDLSCGITVIVQCNANGSVTYL